LGADHLDLEYRRSAHHEAEDISISLIIATRDRCESLSRCLQCVKQITFARPWELILVDNGSIDDTAVVMRESMSEVSFPVVYLLEARPGKSHALNTALSMSHGKIIAFTDDDCYPAPDFLSTIWPAFDDTSIGYIAGRIILHDPTDAAITINESTTPLTFPGRSLLSAGSIQGANMAFRRRVLLEIGGFDPLMGPGTPFVAEDLDVASRASAMGWEGRYCPQVVVRHHHGRKASDVPDRFKSYGFGIGAYHMKLLLRGHEFGWFAQILYQAPGRYKQSRRMFFSELVGAAKYLYLYLVQALCTRFLGTRKLGDSIANSPRNRDNSVVQERALGSKSGELIK
jgi:glycosyltransferase involved in cell wall biosynthesis